MGFAILFLCPELLLDTIKIIFLMQFKYDKHMNADLNLHKDVIIAVHQLS